MNSMDELFPSIKRSLENLIEDEEGNIPGKKLLTLGTMIVILGSLMSIDVFAGHRSHSSHKSHSSHSSHSSGSHGSHGNHASHVSHQSHQSHTSHSNTASHSNSRYSSEGDVTYSAPAASKVPGISTSTVTTTAEIFKLPDVNQNIEVPNSTPSSSIVPTLAVPAPSAGAQIDANDLNNPSPTGEIK